MTQVKICGIRRTEEGRAALAAGADMLGFVFHSPSKRWVAPAAAARVVWECRELRGGWLAVGVFVNQTAGVINEVCRLAQLDAAQLCGEEEPDLCAEVRVRVFKVVRMPQAGFRPDEFERATRAYRVERFLLDTEVEGEYGGTGQAVDWQGLAGLTEQCILAGGLRPHNVAQALRTLRPWGVDVSSGVERGPAKDPQLITQFLQEVRSFDRGAS